MYVALCNCEQPFSKSFQHKTYVTALASILFTLQININGFEICAIPRTKLFVCRIFCVHGLFICSATARCESSMDESAMWSSAIFMRDVQPSFSIAYIIQKWMLRSLQLTLKMCPFPLDLFAPERCLSSWVVLFSAIPSVVDVCVWAYKYRRCYPAVFAAITRHTDDIMCSSCVASVVVAVIINIQHSYKFH